MTNARTLRLICVPVTAQGRDPIVQIRVSRSDDAWQIVHISAAGAHYDRSTQYQISRTTGALSWHGRHMRKPDTQMDGEITFGAGKYFYRETVYCNGSLCADVPARCEQY